MKKVISLLLLFVIFSCGIDDDILHTHIELQKLYDESELAGLSVAIVDNRKVLYKNSFGYSDINKNRRYTNHTIQNIGSISKTFIALAVMKAVEQGKLDLDTNINTYLPFDVIHPFHPEKPITVRHLATHTSGITDREVYYKSYVFENPAQVDVSIYPEDYQPIVELIKTNVKIDESVFFENVLSASGPWYSQGSFTENAPGEKYDYSNIAAALAAFVVENATGISYENYTHKYIFDPLHMDATGWSFSDVNMQNHATLYYAKDFEVPRYSLVTKADGGLITSTSDFSKYLIEMMRGYKGKGKLLSAESYEEMFRLQSKYNEIKEAMGGIFWGINNNNTIEHTGGDPGIITACMFDPIKNRGYYLMTNTSEEFNINIERSIEKIWNTLINENPNRNY
ncbi:serine hydrolase domain-containing protein [Aquimarina megaterium]|uniref:serine hydrolase domain-containing protein n=1 Tax=Aquimarina megaterium TaxID=1443666 RepID=UPI000470B122|nr:serine hydrolase domain-containing protein [Aquimarina megaterium]